MMPVDPQKQVDYPEAPWDSQNAETWFRWMGHHPHPIEAVDAAENAGLLRQLLQWAIGVIDVDLRIYDREVQAERRATQQAAWRECMEAMTGEVPF